MSHRPAPPNEYERIRARQQERRAQFRRNVRSTAIGAVLLLLALAAIYLFFAGISGDANAAERADPELALIAASKSGGPIILTRRPCPDGLIDDSRFSRFGVAVSSSGEIVTVGCWYRVTDVDGRIVAFSAAWLGAAGDASVYRQWYDPGAFRVVSLATVLPSI